MKNFTFLFSLIFSVIFSNIKSEYIDTRKLTQDINFIQEALITSNITSIATLCDEGDINDCYNRCTLSIDTMNFFNTTLIESSLNLSERQLMIDYNNILSEYWFYAGQTEYWGLIKKKPNLVEGFSKFVISSFYGNPKAYYKLFTIIETDIIKLIIDTGDFENLKSSNTIVGENLNHIFNSNKTNFSKNFYYKDEYEKNSIAIQFLYSSAISKYPPAMTTIAFKYRKGYGLINSCKSALKYYKETASYNIKHITERKKPNYYEKVNLESYEYVAHKFSTEIVDTNHLIDYLKVEALNGQIKYILQLGQRYLYGQGIPQNFHEAFFYYEMGSKMNDSESIYYLGEMYLNGWGVEKNYAKAFNLLSQAMDLNYSKAWNSLGYMYFYGLGVEKNIKRAYDYFKISFSKGEDSDAYFNMATLLTEGNAEIEVDFSDAYKYSNFIAAKGHTFGTYWFSMLNQYQLGSILNSCEITIEFFKQVAERNLLSKYKFDTAFRFYREGFHKISALIYLELAEEGYEFGQINAGLIFKNYDIFVSSSFNKFLSFKYFKMAYKMKNNFAALMLADFYYYGFGDLPTNYSKAKKLYKEIIQSGDDNDFYTAHAYFGLGLMNHFGNDVDRNYTKAMKYYNISTTYEQNAFYPEFLMKRHIEFNTSDFTEILKDKIISFVANIFTPAWSLYSILTFIFIYVSFFISLKLQKD